MQHGNAGGSEPLPLDPGDPRRFLRLLRYALILVTGAGLALRIAQYAYDRSLRIDEAMLALNLMHRSPAQLTGSLNFNQAAPFGFLWTEWLVENLAGHSEYALRAVPLAAAVAASLLFVPLARRVAGDAAVIAVALFAVADGVIFFASDLKQYSLDVAVAIVFLLLGSTLVRRDVSNREAAAAAVGGGTLVWMSHPSVFVIGGVGTVALAVSVAGRGRDRILRTIAIVGAWGGSGLAMILLLPGQLAGIRGGSGDTAGGAFPAGGGGLGATAHWLVRVSVQVVMALGMPRHGPAIALTVIGALLGLTGVVALAHTRPILASMLVAPLFLVLVASWLHRYPLWERTLLFTVPMLVTFVAVGILAAAQRSPAPAMTLALLSFAVLAAPAWTAVAHLRRPRVVEEIKPALSYVRAHWQKGDLLYVNYETQYAFAYYEECTCFDLSRPGAKAALWPVAWKEGGSGQFAQAIESRSPAVVIGQEADDEWADYVRAVRSFRGGSACG